ncbi:hypothetical protein ACJ41O_003604 [Fusarium nematophilum]
MKITAALIAGLMALGASARNPLTPEKAVADIEVQKLQRNLWNFNKIARDNGGNRAFGTPGFEASAEYVLERAQTRFATTMDTHKQYFNHRFYQYRSISLAGPEGEDVSIIALGWTPPTPNVGQGPTTAQLLHTPVDDERGSMCFEDQWDGIDATGKIVLVKRGLCPIYDKVGFAKTHGALAVLLYNDEPGSPLPSTLTAAQYDRMIATGIIPQDIGQAWASRLAAGEELTVIFYLDVTHEERETFNIISETKAGDPNNVIVLGAHLDSVLQGPGINDDGSGASALLEIMGSFKKYTPSSIKNKIRFIWWGAEELGLVGSLFYTENLSEEERDKIRFYFNYDMIASIDPFFEVQEGANPGDAYGAALLTRHLVDQGFPAVPGEFGTGSDYVGFIEIGIPCSGLFTGAGEPNDPCYHQECDDLTNIHWDAFAANAKAAAYAAAVMATGDLSDLPTRARTTPVKRGVTTMRRKFKRWASLAETVTHSDSCAHGEQETL